MPIKEMHYSSRKRRTMPIIVKIYLEAIHLLNKTIATAIQQMSSSVLQVAQGMTRSIELLSKAMLISSNSPNTELFFPQQKHFPTHQQYK